MTGAPLAPYPALRPRRLRQADWIRRLTRETVLTPNDLIWSMVVHDGPEDRIPVPSMPGVERLSVAEAAKAAVRARALGIPAIAVFPHIDGAKKDSRGSEAENPEGLIAQAVRAMKDAAPEVGIMCDVALDPFTEHGHDGLIENGRILNDPTIERLVEQGLMQAAAGADMVMVKPGMPYLDIVRRVVEAFSLPTFAFQVSGEYAMIMAAARNGWIDEERAIMESLAGFKRAGCSGVITYFAERAAGLLGA